MDGQISLFDLPEFAPAHKPTNKTYAYPCSDCKKCEGLTRKCNTDPFKTFCKEFVRRNEQNQTEIADEDKAGLCEYCAWWDKANGYDKVEGCFWEKEYPAFLDKEEIQTHSCWLPKTNTMKICATCRHTNPFCYEGENMHEPIINNDLYCELADFHNKTPINRIELFKEYRSKKEFGVGYYHRNHEYDTCDCWEGKND